MTHKIKPDDTSPDNANTASATESPCSANTQTPPQSNNTINKETNTTAPSTTDEEAIEQEIQIIRAAAERLGRMLDPELDEDEEAFSIDIGLANATAYQMGYNPHQLLKWLEYALTRCDIDLKEHPISGLLEICEGYFWHEEVVKTMKEVEEIS